MCNNINDKIRKELFALSDEKYKKFHSNLCPNVNNIIGVRLPFLREISKKLSKEDFKIYLSSPYNDYYEEVMIEGLTIGYIKVDNNTRFEYMKNFIPKIDNWGICDSFCNNLKFTKKNMFDVWDFIITYINSSSEFELRFVIVMMLNFYIIDDYIDKVLDILNNIHHQGYYVKMAIAWAISYAYISFPDKTLSFFDDNNLDKFTYNKSLQKIIESNRVSKDDKDFIRSLKK